MSSFNTKECITRRHNSFFPELAFVGQETQKIVLSNGIVVEKLDSIYVIGGDIILSYDQVQRIGTITKSSIYSSYVNLWPSGKVYYQFDPSVSQNMKEIVVEGMEMWSSTTGLEFFERTYGDRIYIIQTTGQNASALGCQRNGTQNLWISSYSKGVAAHELGHAIGLLHEHQRPDRNDYININYNQIQSGKEHNFTLPTGMFFSTENIDYNSIMMYDSYDFAIGNIPVLTRKDGSIWNSQRTYLTNSDVLGVRSIYGPPFYNVEQYRLVDNSWNNFTSEIIDIEYANDVYFYSDKSCTQSVTNDINRLVLLKRIEEARVDGVVTMYNEEDLLIEVPSGKRSYSLPNSNYYQEYQLGNETRFHEVRYVVAL